MRYPLISIIIPALNEGKHVSECIDSFVRQTAGEFEIILVDDGSNDATLEIVSARIAQYERVALIRNETTLGLPATLNRGLGAAKGDFLTWVSADNFVSDDFVEKLSEVLRTQPETDIVYGDTVTIGANGGLLQRLAPLDVDYLPEKNVLRSCFMFRKRVFEVVGPYRERWFMVEDFEFWLRCLEADLSIRYVAGPVVFHRLHESSLTFRFSKRIALLDLFVRSAYLRRCLASSKSGLTGHIAQLTKDIVRHGPSHRSLRYALGWSLRASPASRPQIWFIILKETIRRRLRRRGA